ncbi:hypothetical protein D1619_30010, partial [Klebsiella pneumoniae]
MSRRRPRRRTATLAKTRARRSRRATHLDGGRGCRVRLHQPGMGSLPGIDRGGGRGRGSRGRLQ